MGGAHANIFVAGTESHPDPSKQSLLINEFGPLKFNQITIRGPLKIMIIVTVGSNFNGPYSLISRLSFAGSGGDLVPLLSEKDHCRILFLGILGILRS